ncbi:MAG: hypothetical protein SGPRY_013136 [Prymnesium sp.]
MNVLGVGNNVMTAGSVQGMSTAEEVIRERRRQEWLAQLDSQVKQKEALRAAERMKQTAEMDRMLRSSEADADTRLRQQLDAFSLATYGRISSGKA